MSKLKKVVGIFCFSWVIIAKVTRGFTATSSSLINDGLHFDLRTFMCVFLVLVCIATIFFSIYQLIKLWENRNNQEGKKRLLDFTFYTLAIAFSGIIIMDYL